MKRRELRTVFLLILILTCTLQPLGVAATDDLPGAPARDSSLSAVPPALAALAQRTAGQPLQNGTLDNGLEWILLPDDRLPVCRVLLAFPAGTASEPEEYCGIASLSLQTLVNADAEFKKLRLAGSPAEVIILKDFSLISLTIPTSRLTQALTGIAATLKNASLERSEINAESDRARDRLDDGPESPFVEAVQSIEEELFAGCGYSHPPTGTRNGIRKTSWNHANEWLSRARDPQGLKLIFSGAVPDGFPGDQLASLFGELKSAGQSKLLPEARNFRRKQSPARSVEAPSLPLSECVVGFPAAPAGDPDYPALKFLAAALRHAVPEGIRAAAWYPTQREAGVFYLELSRLDGQPIAHSAAAGCLQELDRMLDDAKDFAALQEAILTEIAATRMTAVTRADHVATTRMTGRTLENYRGLITDLLQLQVPQLKDVRQRFLDPEKAVFAGGYPE